MDREEAFILSFWIFLPASIGAFILESMHIEGVNLGIEDVFIWLITFVVGVLALKVLRKALLGRYFWAFSLYTLFLSLLSFFLFFPFKIVVVVYEKIVIYPFTTVPPSNLC
jgi:undecaprenyl pyrophosphate phosphatase UppP